ncbi:hypothetical protein J6590_035543 [Homalodisca vitripennis]|nr:hypothetical protein J6590_035543 [Homalodisca vitripennis]
MNRKHDKYRDKSETYYDSFQTKVETFKCEGFVDSTNWEDYKAHFLVLCWVKYIWEDSHRAEARRNLLIAYVGPGPLRKVVNVLIPLKIHQVTWDEVVGGFSNFEEQIRFAGEVNFPKFEIQIRQRWPKGRPIKEHGTPMKTEDLLEWADTMELAHRENGKCGLQNAYGKCFAKQQKSLNCEKVGNFSRVGQLKILSRINENSEGDDSDVEVLNLMINEEDAIPKNFPAGRVPFPMKTGSNPTVNIEKNEGSVWSKFSIRECFIPTFEELTSKIERGKEFSIIRVDLRDAYLLMEDAEEHRKYVVIATDNGYYRYTRLPFGVS